MSKLSRTLLAVALASSLAACTQVPPPTTSPVEEGARTSIGRSTEVTRVEYPEDGVICYVSVGYRSGGISCLPIKQGE